MPLVKSSRTRWAVLTASVVWALAIGLGFVRLAVYEAAPGPIGQPLERWPALSRIPLAGDRPTIVMAVHPRCPCTRASVSELARLLARCEGRVEVYIPIFAPEQAGRAWGQVDWLVRIGTLPGVHLVDDPGGVEAMRFGALTSGHLVLFTPDGRLLYSGGITGARGHEGDNAGRQALQDLISTRHSACRTSSPLIELPPPAGGRRSPWTNSF
jgi:hypothetical protein